MSQTTSWPMVSLTREHTTMKRESASGSAASISPNSALAHLAGDDPLDLFGRAVLLLLRADHAELQGGLTGHVGHLHLAGDLAV